MKYSTPCNMNRTHTIEYTPARCTTAVLVVCAGTLVYYWYSGLKYMCTIG